MYIELTQGKQATIDQWNSDLADVNWYVQRLGSCGNPRFYAVRHSSRTAGKQHRIYLHRVIMERMLGRILEPWEQIDHKNCNGLDDSETNLRIASSLQNQRNKRPAVENKTSQYKGVHWNKNESKWVSSVRVNGTLKHLGYFVLERDAALAYDSAAELYFKDFARLNFPTGA